MRPKRKKLVKVGHAEFK